MRALSKKLSILRFSAFLFLMALLPGMALCNEEAVTKLSRQVTIGGEKFTVSLVKAKLDRVQIKVGLARDRVGPTENLDSIAKRNKAIAGINGSFFDAYVSSPIKSPHHTVITEGKVVHVGNVGTLCWFNDSNEARMERLQFSIEGSINGSYKYPQRWFAYWINRYPTADTITIFTPEWGESTGLSDGTQIVVSRGIVKGIGTGSRKIPADGFVIYIRNIYNQLHQKFKVGDRVEYRLTIKNGDARSFFEQAREGVGAGPLLVKNGKVSVDPGGEGFTSEKILTLSCGRSALGVTRDGWMLMATTTATIRQLAEIMKGLGCEYAMNLDGGASSALWYKGSYITPPGREISNALLVIEKPIVKPAPSASTPGASPTVSASPGVSVSPAVSVSPGAAPSPTPLISPAASISPPAPPAVTPGLTPGTLAIIAAAIVFIVIIVIVILLALWRPKSRGDESGDRGDEPPPEDFNF